MTPPTLRVLPRPPRAAATRRPLLCLPYAGGGTRSYESWQPLLPQTVDLLTLRLPGRETRAEEPPATDLAGLADDIAAELGPRLPGRFGLFGHSMGGLLAYEVARRLRDTYDAEPACLIVSGTRPPDRRAEERRYSELDDEQLREAVGAMGGTDAGVLHDPDVWGLVAPVIRGDLELCDSYRYEPAKPLSCPVVAYGSQQDPDVDSATVEHWAHFTTGPFASRMFPGDHFYFRTWPEAFAMDLVNRLYDHLWDADR
jgi:surfactin synthase thioesterase subunit